jgi:hypothetical protein
MADSPWSTMSDEDFYRGMADDLLDWMKHPPCRLCSVPHWTATEHDHAYESMPIAELARFAEDKWKERARGSVGFALRRVAGPDA